MKRFYLKSCLIIAIIIPLMAMAFQGDILEDISLGIRTGNAKAVAKYFDKNVEITILDKEDIYSKAQGEIIIQQFFEQYQPKGFNIIHKGSSGQGAEYAIGSLSFNAGTFRTYIYLKEKESSYLIQEIRFEKD